MKLANAALAWAQLRTLEAKVRRLERQLETARALSAEVSADPEPEVVRARIRLDEFRARASDARKALASRKRPPE